MVETFARSCDDTGSIVLQHTRHRSDAQRLVRIQSRRHGILRLDGKLRLSGRAHGRRPVFRRLHDLHLQTGVLVVTECLRRIQSRMVGVRRPVQTESDLCQFFASLRGGRLISRGAAGGKPQNHGSPQHKRRRFFPVILSHFLLLFLPLPSTASIRARAD